MGAAASAMDENTFMSLDKMKEIAGDQWTEKLEGKISKRAAVLLRNMRQGVAWGQMTPCLTSHHIFI
jgi:hypothetical protein